MLTPYIPPPVFPLPSLLQTEEDPAPRCEYCGSWLKPFPPFEGVYPPWQEDPSVSWWGG